MNLGATLYLNNSNEAAELYIAAFGMTLGYNVMNLDGTFLHAELLKNGKSIFAVSESTDPSTAEAILKSARPTMSYEIDLEGEDELNKAYQILIDGGRILRPLGALPWSPISADVIDKYGVCWYIFTDQMKPDYSAMAQ